MSPMVLYPRTLPTKNRAARKRLVNRKLLEVKNPIFTWFQYRTSSYSYRLLNGHVPHQYDG